MPNLKNSTKYKHWSALQHEYIEIKDLDKNNPYEVLAITNKEIETIYDAYVDECYGELNFD